MAQTLQDIIAKDRERLRAEKNSIQAQMRELEKKLSAIDREFDAIEAYEAAKSGRAARQAGTQAAPSNRESKRDNIIAMLAANPTGLTRGEILEQMGLKGNKSGEMSVSNALTSLTKSKRVARKDRKYIPAQV